MKPRANKYLGIARLLEARVKRGDYAFRSLPSENELAEETDVSRMTARKALMHLIDAGVLCRPRHGRVEIANNRKGKRGTHQFAFLMPPVISEDVQSWQWAVEETAAKVGGVVRTVIFTDWNDVLMADALKGFDGVFLMQTGVEVPPEALKMLLDSQCPIVSLDLDLSEHGIPSIYMFPQEAIWKLLEHVHELGHRRIACLNTVTMNVVIQRRIDNWEDWKTARGTEGRLYSFPGDSSIRADYGAIQAQAEFGRLLDERAFEDTAVLCTNVWTALGVQKAMHQRGLQVGRALSVCTVNDELLAPWLIPSLTSLRMADTRKMLDKCITWMMSGGKKWSGALLLVPADVPLYIGESTGPGPVV